MTEKKKNVYCMECKHCGRYVMVGLCMTETYYEDTAMYREKVYASCWTRNKNNDCNWWEKKKSKLSKEPQRKVPKGAWSTTIKDSGQPWWKFW